MLKKFPTYGRQATSTPPLEQTLRRLILARIHAGSLQAGDRLPSVREVADRSGVDHRVAARAYRTLEAEGLVEVRARSGVYVSESLGGSPAEGGQSWAADILFEAWQKGIARSSLCELFGGAVVSPLRCGCIESNEDHMIALTSEIEEGLSLEMVPMFVDGSAGERTAPPEDLDDVDLLVTSVFHARYARRVAAAAGKPVAVLNLRPEFTAEIGKRLSAGPVIAVIADPEYARRGREFFSAIGQKAEARFVTVDEARRERVDPDGENVVATRAARRRMGLHEYHLVPFTCMISEESARALCEIVAGATPARRARPSLPEPGARGRALLSAGETPAPPQLERPLEEKVADVEHALRQHGLFEALRVLNAMTPHRFTGLYQFETDRVRSVVLVDRQNPHLTVGADVPMKESYCVLTAEGGDFMVNDALGDPRLEGHKARGAVLCYCAVHLLDPEGASWGTLCHYDLRPTEVAEETLAVLKAVRPLIQATLGPATPHVRALPECAAIPSSPAPTAARRKSIADEPDARRRPPRIPGPSLPEPSAPA